MLITLSLIKIYMLDKLNKHEKKTYLIFISTINDTNKVKTSFFLPDSEEPMLSPFPWKYQLNNQNQMNKHVILQD